MTPNKKYRTRLAEIERLAAALEDHKSNLQAAAARDAGFPVKITSVEVDLSVQYLRTMQEEIPLIADGRPYGTVATIIAYDAPAVQLARLAGACLLTGNRLRFSISSQTPQSAEVIKEICASFDSIEPVIGPDNRAFGRSCIEDQKVRVLFISGASEVGDVYRRRHRSFDKLFFAGPGGMPAAVVFKDAEAEAAGRFISRRAFINGGQYCTTLKKAHIHSSLYPAVREQILDAVQHLKVGDPFDPETVIGPIRIERTRRILQNALDQCADALLITGAIDGETVFPLVLETEKSHIPDLELFGPFLILKPFDDPQQAAAELVRTRYGFLLAFFGSPPDSVKKRFLAHFGMVHDNPDFTFTPLRLPFGGKNASGWIIERRGEEWIERDGAFQYSRELVQF